VVVVFAAVLVPTASPKSGARVDLSVLPLPASELGSAAPSLPLQPHSGAHSPLGGSLIPNRSSTLGQWDFWAKRGWIRGYELDYGLGASGGAGVTEVLTNVDEYKTSADAKKGLAIQKGRSRWVTHYGKRGLSVAIKKEKVAAVGARRFAFLVSYSAANIAPV